MEKIQICATPANEKPDRREKTILVIDDSHDLLDLYKSILESDECRVFTAASGEDALVVLTKIAKPDLILLDMRMEDMSGPEFVLVLETKYPAIFASVPVVFLTAMDEVPECKVAGIINKVMDIDKFLADVHRYIEEGAGRSPNKH